MQCVFHLLRIKVPLQYGYNHKSPHLSRPFRTFAHKRLHTDVVSQHARLNNEIWLLEAFIRNIRVLYLCLFQPSNSQPRFILNLRRYKHDVYIIIYTNRSEVNGILTLCTQFFTDEDELFFNPSHRAIHTAQHKLMFLL